LVKFLPDFGKNLTMIARHASRIVVEALEDAPVVGEKLFAIPVSALWLN